MRPFVRVVAALQYEVDWCSANRSNHAAWTPRSEPCFDEEENAAWCIRTTMKSTAGSFAARSSADATQACWRPPVYPTLNGISDVTSLLSMARNSTLP